MLNLQPETSAGLFNNYYHQNYFERSRRETDFKMQDGEPKFFTSLVEVILSRPRFEPQIKFFSLIKSNSIKTNSRLLLSSINQLEARNQNYGLITQYCLY